MIEHRRAIVTGGTRGIGAAITRRLCAEGYQVTATYRSGAPAAARLRNEIGDALSIESVDGCDAQAVANLVAGLGDQPIDLLVNNAGISHAALASKTTAPEAEGVFRTNLFQAIHYVSAVLPSMMRRRSGDIVMIGSLAASNIRAGNCLYGASKAALERYALGVAQEAARFNVAVNVVSPGFVRTDLSDAVLGDDRDRAIRASLPSRRLTEPDEIAESVSYLVARKPMLIGTVLPVGGGGQL